jgi:predicted Zn finger-like uncharacterized protein
MIIQCEACQTRFRIAVEKVKPGGTKVRCSKCKAIFTVFPPQPEPAEDAVDFGAFNMERLAEDAPAPDERMASEPPAEPATSAPPQPESPADTALPRGDGEFDFSDFADETGSAAGGDEEHDHGPAVDDTWQATGDAEAGLAPAAADDEFSFEETPRLPGEAAELPAAPEDAEATGFASEDHAGPAEFSFDEQDEPMAFSFDDSEEEPKGAAAEDFTAPGEFSFDDEPPLGGDAAEWGDTAQGGDGSAFDFDEPHFDGTGSPAAGRTTASAEGGMNFGEIDFAGDGASGTAAGLQAGEAVATTRGERQESVEPLVQKQQSSAPPSRGYDLDEPIPRPKAKKKKSSLSRILVLLVLLLVVLGGATGYLYLQEGAVNLNSVIHYLPFLKDYLGQPATTSPGDRIGIKIIGSSYVNGRAGQMLVIQGAAVNNHPTTRSAITIKGVLLDAQGKKLLQQTVFCGNKLDEAALKSMPFSAIEEAMNNQFGDSLSNMNVAAGASIPFTIVFRNLPAGIANINVEVVDSKPGAG